MGWVSRKLPAGGIKKRGDATNENNEWMAKPYESLPLHMP